MSFRSFIPLFLSGLLSLAFWPSLSYASAVVYFPSKPIAPPLPPAAPNLSLALEEPISIRSTHPPSTAAPAPIETTTPLNEKMQITAEDPATGQIIHIDISSKNLNYNSQTGLYTVTGDVYIIVPEKSLEILSDEATYDPKSSSVVAAGNVFIINKDSVLGSEKAKYDLKTNVSFYNNARTTSNTARIQAITAERADYFTLMRDGRLILNPEFVDTFSIRYRRRGLRFGQASVYAMYSAKRRADLLEGDMGNLITEGDGTVYNMDDTIVMRDSKTAATGTKPISPNDVLEADFSTRNSPYRFKVKTLNIHRKADGFDDIVFKNMTSKYKSIPLFWSPYMDFGYQEEKQYLTYLGPEMGYNVDFGGFYFGPGWDFRLFDGWVKFSPIISYGGGTRVRVHNDQPKVIDPQFGIGFLGHYRSPTNVTDYGYSNVLKEHIFLSEQQMFGRPQTRLRLAINQFYRSGFYGTERPRRILELTDSSMFGPWGNWILRTYASAGVAKDDFFPIRRGRFFVRGRSAEPITTTRIQLQGQLRSVEPLLYLGKYGAIGALAQGRIALYGTGQQFGVFQAGPYINLVVGPWFSQARYLYGQTAGSTPFVFDSFYRGRNNLQTINSLDIGKYITIGAVHNLNLDRSNSQRALVVGKNLFLSVGSKNVRFSVSYDALQKISYFGLLINPEGGQLIMDFDNFNIYEPGYDPALHQPLYTVVAPKKRKKPAQAS